MNVKIELNSLYKIFSKFVDTVAVENFSEKFYEQEISSLAGPSGSGKTTILNCIGGLIRPTSGRIFVDQRDISKFSDDQLVEYRKNKVGIIYQDYNLINEFTIFENIAVPILIAKKSRDLLNKRVNKLMDSLGISRYRNTYPPYLSGGEKQRVAMAVALSNDPDIILADEPTGSLDLDNSKIVLDLLITEARKREKTLIIATHDQFILERVDRIINL